MDFIDQTHSKICASFCNTKHFIQVEQHYNVSANNIIPHIRVLMTRSADAPCLIRHSMAPSTHESGFLASLPPEIRVMIYRLCLDLPSSSLRQARMKKFKERSAIVRVCRLIRQEALPIYRDSIKAGIKIKAFHIEKAERKRDFHPRGNIQSSKGKTVLGQRRRGMMYLERLLEEFPDLDECVPE